jgi:hypothetical protein
MVIADYPGSPYLIGEIRPFVQGSFFTTYPAIFRPLAWYEEREEHEIPNFVKNAADGVVFKVRSVNNFGDYPKCLVLKGNENPFWHSFSDLLPATEEEYNNQ